DAHFVPLAVFLGGILGRRNAGYDATRIVISELGVLLLVAGIVDLHLDALLDGLLEIADVEIEPAIASLFELVFELGFEVLVLLLGPQIGVIALPTRLSVARHQSDDAIVAENPVALGKALLGQVLAEEIDPIFFLRGANAGENDD